MVVMAIIAILATAWLSAYTGYIKKARDATRIADLRAINTVIQSSLSVTWAPPATTAIAALVTAFNNGQMIRDPLTSTPGEGKKVCLDSTGANIFFWCDYLYMLCDNGMWYLLSAQFESKSNLGLYADNAAGPWGANWLDTWTYGMSNASTYDIGSCKGYIDWAGTVFSFDLSGYVNDFTAQYFATYWGMT